MSSLSCQSWMISNWIISICKSDEEAAAGLKKITKKSPASRLILAATVVTGYRRQAGRPGRVPATRHPVARTEYEH